MRNSFPLNDVERLGAMALPGAQVLGNPYGLFCPALWNANSLEQALVSIVSPVACLSKVVSEY